MSQKDLGWRRGGGQLLNLKLVESEPNAAQVTKFRTWTFHIIFQNVNLLLVFGQKEHLQPTRNKTYW